MTEQAKAAIRAAKNQKSWGRHATALYLKKRGVPLSLYTLARILDNAERAGL